MLASEAPIEREDDQLHQQLGSEVLYLLLVVFAGLSLVMAGLYLAAQRSSANALVRAGALEWQLEQGQRRTDKPPIIVLRGSQGFSFASGSAEVSAAFADALRGSIVPVLLAERDRHAIDLIEIVGHTDEEPIAGHSRLDQSLLPFLAGADVALAVGDNVGLGMARAAAVARLLSSDGRLGGVRFTCLSAGQTSHPDGRSAAHHARPAGPEASRRRVEIRLRRSGE